MTDELFLAIGKAIFPKLGVSVKADEITDEVKQNLLSAATGLMTEEQAAAAGGVRNRVMAELFSNADKSVRDYVANHRLNKVSGDRIKEIFEGSDKTSHKFTALWEAQTEAFLKEIENMKGDKSGLSEKEKKAYEAQLNKSAELLEAERKLKADLQGLLDAEKQARARDKIDSKLLSYLSSKTWNAANDDIKQTLIDTTLERIHNSARLTINDQGEISVLDKSAETDVPLFNDQTSQPIKLNEFAELQARPFLAAKQKVDDSNIKNLPEQRQRQKQIERANLSPQVLAAMEYNKGNR